VIPSGDGETLDTTAIQKIIDACAEAGGGFQNITIIYYCPAAIYNSSQGHFGLIA